MCLPRCKNKYTERKGLKLLCSNGNSNLFAKKKKNVGLEKPKMYRIILLSFQAGKHGPNHIVCVSVRRRRGQNIFEEVLNTNVCSSVSPWQNGRLERWLMENNMIAFFSVLLNTVVLFISCEVSRPKKIMIYWADCEAVR